MPVSVIVGGQYGSEGKGKVAYEWVKRKKASFAVRVGGSNSGHTVIDESGRSLAFRQLPTASILEGVISVIAPGSYIDPEVLMEEIAITGLTPEHLWIDPRAVLITDEHKEEERSTRLMQRIGSTGSGTGAALVNRIQRRENVKFIGDDHRFVEFLQDTRRKLRRELTQDRCIVIEGTQGFGLSLLHSDHFPKVTSRDTTASAFVSEVGLSPLDVDEVVLVLRTYPIRVAGDSGPLLHETTWAEIEKSSGSHKPIVEYSTVTKQVRRVAEFDPSVVRAAIEANAPTHIVMNHLDYVCAQGQEEIGKNDRVRNFVKKIENEIRASIDMLGFSPSTLMKRDEFLQAQNKDIFSPWGAQ